MPTGVSTNKESLYEWFKAGVACVGIGSELMTKEIIKNKDYKKLADDARRVISLIREIREELSK